MHLTRDVNEKRPRRLSEESAVVSEGRRVTSNGQTPDNLTAAHDGPQAIPPCPQVSYV